MDFVVDVTANAVSFELNRMNWAKPSRQRNICMVIDAIAKTNAQYCDKDAGTFERMLPEQDPIEFARSNCSTLFTDNLLRPFFYSLREIH